MISKPQYIIPFLILIGTFIACTKGSYITPEVSIISIIQSGDTTFLDIEVKDFGEPIVSIGVGYEIGQSPSVSDNQMIYDGGRGLLRIPVLNLRPETTYEFIAFAVNDYSFDESNIVSFYVPLRATSEPPCDLAPNEVNFAGANYTPNLVRYGGKVVSFQAPGHRMDFTFATTPTSGNYITSKIGQNFPNEVTVVVGSFNRIPLESSDTIFVEKLDEEKFRLRFCDLKYKTQSGNIIELKGDFITD